MTKPLVDATSIVVNKKYFSIITSYLEKNNIPFNISSGEKDEKLRLEIIGLDPQTAFYLGANTQIQLLDGESLV